MREQFLRSHQQRLLTQVWNAAAATDCETRAIKFPNIEHWCKANTRATSWPARRLRSRTALAAALTESRTRVVLSLFVIRSIYGARCPAEEHRIETILILNIDLIEGTCPAIHHLYSLTTCELG